MSNITGNHCYSTLLLQFKIELHFTSIHYYYSQTRENKPTTNLICRPPSILLPPALLSLRRR